MQRAYADRGYRNHKDSREIFLSGQRRGVTSWIKKELKRRQAIEPHFGHMKNEGRLGLNRLHGKLGDQINALMSGIAHNMRWIGAQLSLSG